MKKTAIAHLGFVWLLAGLMTLMTGEAAEKIPKERESHKLSYFAVSGQLDVNLIKEVRIYDKEISKRGKLIEWYPDPVLVITNKTDIQNLLGALRIVQDPKLMRGLNPELRDPKLVGDRGWGFEINFKCKGPHDARVSVFSGYGYYVLNLQEMNEDAQEKNPPMDGEFYPHTGENHGIEAWLKKHGLEFRKGTPLGPDTDEEDMARNRAQFYQLNQETSVSKLIEALRDKQENIRETAAYNLSRFSSHRKTIIPVLIEALQDSDENVRVAAAITLGEIDIGAQSAPALAKSLKDANTYVKQAAAIALGNMGPKAGVAVQNLVDMSLDQDEALAAYAYGALARITSNSEGNIALLVDSVKLKSRPWPESFLDPISTLRWNSVRALGLIGARAKSAIPALTDVLKDNDKLVVIESHCALALITGRFDEHISGLLKTASDKLCRPIVVDALKRMGLKSKSAVPMIIDGLKSIETAHPETRDIIIESIRQLNTDP